MDEKFDKIAARFDDLTAQLADEEVLKDPSRYQKIAKKRADLEETVIVIRRLQQVMAVIADNEAVIAADEEDDEDLVDLARAEMEDLVVERDDLHEQLKVLMVPRDPNDDRNTIVEIRAGAGGEESALFAGDLMRMYSRFIERRNWKMELMSSNETGIGGFREVIFMVTGPGAYGTLKYESGVHRVQRVPATESSGRIHTSAASVAVLPEAEDVDVNIDPNDLRIDVYRSSGPGGQSVNTTDSAVRITHVPTGMVVSCQDEKSQHKNRAKALKVLQARLLDQAQREERDKRAAERRSQVGSGDRSDKIRTYNFPQQRVTDHRINFTVHRLNEILDGDLDEIIAALAEADRDARMQEQS
ncbi:MAG: peptide chain release factor 1 [Candidatus Krumholzibacteriota bacterium]|nr:peptide chain release factor 1 [Candidatus Krumholzibacteriota bacterium]